MIFFETEEGLSFLARLLIVTLVVFGLKEGVGAETIQPIFLNQCCYQPMLLARQASYVKLSERCEAAIEIYGEAAVCRSRQALSRKSVSAWC